MSRGSATDHADVYATDCAGLIAGSSIWRLPLPKRTLDRSKGDPRREAARTDMNAQDEKLLVSGTLTSHR
jgi:hypothetical protein